MALTTVWGGGRMGGARRFIRPDLASVLETRKSQLVRFQDLNRRLHEARRDYEAAVEDFDEGAAMESYVKVQVLETMTEKAKDIRPVTAEDVAASTVAARIELAQAKQRLLEKARGCDYRSLADPELRQMLENDEGKIPAYATEAVRQLQTFVHEARDVLSKIDELLNILAGPDQRELDLVEARLVQAEEAVGAAERLAEEAAQVKAAIAEANSQYLGA